MKRAVSVGPTEHRWFGGGCSHGPRPAGAEGEAGRGDDGPRPKAEARGVVPWRGVNGGALTTHVLVVSLTNEAARSAGGGFGTGLRYGAAADPCKEGRGRGRSGLEDDDGEAAAAGVDGEVAARGVQSSGARAMA